MVQGHKGSNTSCQECIHETIIKIQATLIDSSRSLGKNTWPRNGETIGIQAESGHQRYILRHTVVMVGSDISVISLVNLTWSSCELIPDGRTAPIFIRCALYLIGCSCRPPEKIRGEGCCNVSVDSCSWFLVIGYAHYFSFVAFVLRIAGRAASLHPRATTRVPTSPRHHTFDDGWTSAPTSPRHHPCPYYDSELLLFSPP